MRSSFIAAAVVVCLLCGAVPAQSAPVSLASIGGSANAGLPLASNQWLGFYWTQSVTYYDVNIAIYGFGSGDGLGTAWLVSESSGLLASTSAVNVGASTFSGLTLGPGTYAFLLTTPSPNASAGWTSLWPYAYGPFGAGVTWGGFIFTSSGVDPLTPSGWYGWGWGYDLFHAPMEITGSTSAPDPGSTLLLFGIGVVGLRVWGKWRR